MSSVAVERLIFARGKLESVLAPLVLLAVTAQATGTIVSWRIENTPRLRADPAFVDANRSAPDLPVHFTSGAVASRSYATVREGGLSVTGPRSLESIRDAVKAVTFQCSVDGSLPAVAQRGLVGVQLTIGSSGQVVAARDVSTTTLDRPGRDCIARSFFAMPSVGAADDDTTVTYTVTSLPRPAETNGLTAQGVQNVVRAHSAGVKRACWERRTGSQSSGNVTVSVTVAPNGTVSAASGAGDDREIAKCVESQVRSWTFPKPSQTTSVVIPFHFVMQ